MIFKIIPYNSPDWTKAVRLRERILREPLGSKFSEDELKEEKNHIHIAGFELNEVVATAVLVPEADQMKMQRVAVLESLRNQNIGSQMMLFCEDIAKEKAIKIIYCHARDSAVNFYARNSYQKVGEYFDEDGIPHLKMVKEL